MGPGNEISIFEVLLSYAVFALPVFFLIMYINRKIYKNNFSDKITFGEYMRGEHFYRFLANNHGPSVKKMEELQRQKKKAEFKALQEEFEKYRVKD